MPTVVEPDKSLAPVIDHANTPVTAMGNNGNGGQVVNSQGDLTFRFGDFFAGKDKEVMRLTAEGNLGIGTDKPQAKLDVVGSIRASEGIQFADKTVLNSATGAGQRLDGGGNLVPAVGGTGTTGRITKWTDGPNGILGDSPLTVDANNN